MSKNPVSRYLDEIIDYGGIPTTRGEVILDMRSQGIDQPCIDRWLQGQELMASIRRRRDPITVKLFLPEKDRAKSTSRNRTS
jgi:hypothetical protein